MRRMLAVCTIVALGAAACESVVGDFSQYRAMPAGCSPTKPTGGAPEFLSCKSGERCEWNGSLFACATGRGSGTRGAACSASSSCAQGLSCLFDHCRAYCESGVASCNSGEVCRETGTSSGTHTYGGCLPANCNPFDPTDGTGDYAPCQPGVECHFADSVSVQCGIGGTTMEGAKCSASAECGPELFCIFWKDTGGKCVWPCRTALGDSDCTSRSKTCSATSSGFAIDGVDYGYCDPP